MDIWTKERAWEWYEKLPWQVGFNFLPSSAVNSTEMWQRSSYDEPTIKKEIGFAKEFGYNSLRVFLPYIVWERERGEFLERFESFLSIAKENGMSVLPILFDDCAFDGGKDPFYGDQGAPTVGIHNGRWTPSPGFRVADDESKQSLLRDYIHAVVGAHKDDERILAWDLYNEPGNSGRANKCLPLLVNVFRWARECSPSQPLTSSPWRTGVYDSTFYAMAELSDIISFHSYDSIELTRSKWVEVLKKQGRPLFVTEWLCRERENSFESHLPYFAKNKISCYNWGLALGKTQTNLWWGVNDPSPEIWQHDVMYADGRFYRPEESALLKELRAKDE